MKIYMSFCANPERNLINIYWRETRLKNSREKLNRHIHTCSVNLMVVEVIILKGDFKSKELILR
jgi:hypothetical protein